MEITRENIQSIVKGLSLGPNKNLGQNFLTDPEVARDVANIALSGLSGSILEIGPGLGSLTHFLLGHGDLTAVDIDGRMIDFLKQQYKGEGKANFLRADIMKTDVSGYGCIVGNLPYYITTDIITYLLLKAESATSITCMIQKEAYPRFSAKVGEEGYSAISILVSLLGTIKKVKRVGSGSFYPNPHVDSLVFRIDIDPSNRNERTFGIYRLAKTLFLNRRKTVQNNLSTLINDKEKAVVILNEVGINPLSRPEELSLDDYSALYTEIGLL